MQQPTGYSRSQILLHWAVAALIAAQFLFSEGIEDAWRSLRQGVEPVFDPMILAHVAGGVLIGVFVVWRLVLRFTRGAPPPPEQEAPLLKLAAHAMHWTLYALMLGLVATGGAAWFGGVGAATGLHGALAPMLMILSLLHVAAALFHQFVLKTNLLARMKRPA